MKSSGSEFNNLCVIINETNMTEWRFYPLKSMVKVLLIIENDIYLL